MKANTANWRPKKGRHSRVGIFWIGASATGLVTLDIPGPKQPGLPRFLSPQIARKLAIELLRQAERAEGPNQEAER